MIGLFDSGLGGLSVAREIRARLPQADILYIADSAYCPYGPRSRREVQARALYCARALVAAGAEMIVVACNTATAAAVELLRAQLSVPIVGMEPGVKPAVAATHAGSIAVLATSGMLASDRFHELVTRFAGHVRVRTIPAPALVTQVERGELDSAATRAHVAAYLADIADADVLVLGCTHFPLLHPVIHAEAGPAVTIIDVNPAVADRTVQLAAAVHAQNGSGQFLLLTTGVPAEVEPAARHVWGGQVTAEALSDYLQRHNIAIDSSTAAAIDS